MHERWFPRLHGRPPSGWVNDPNGLCHVDGTYHVFFQHNPDAPVHDRICWGHVHSTDLRHWTQDRVALRPQPGGLDAAGCWSGCVVDDDGVPTAVYTAVGDQPADAVVALARSDRSLLHWRPDPVSGPAAPAGDPATEVRDPFVFGYRGHRYAVQGAGSRTGPPRLLLYGCDDLNAWVPLGPLLTSADPVAAEVAPAQIWECPNLFPLGPAWVLLVSLWRWVDGTHLLAGVRYLVGELRPAAGGGLTFVPAYGGVPDEGPACYAPQVLVEEDRVLLWAWCRELDRTDEQLAEAGWAGALSFPRVLTLEDGRLVSRPAPELTGLRQEPLDLTGPVEEAAFEVVSTGPVQLTLHRGPAPAPDAAGERAGSTRTVVAVAGTPEEPARILVDGSVVESFAQQRCWTDRAYPDADSEWRVVGDPATTRVYRLGDPRL